MCIARTFNFFFLLVILISLYSMCWFFSLLLLSSSSCYCLLRVFVWFRFSLSFFLSISLSLSFFLSFFHTVSVCPSFSLAHSLSFARRIHIFIFDLVFRICVFNKYNINGLEKRKLTSFIIITFFLLHRACVHFNFFDYCIILSKQQFTHSFHHWIFHILIFHSIRRLSNVLNLDSFPQSNIDFYVIFFFLSWPPK